MKPGKIIKIIILCLVVGLFMHWLGVEAIDFWRWLGNIGKSIGNALADFMRWGWPYILLGAGIVIPIYLVKLILRKRRGE